MVTTYYLDSSVALHALLAPRRKAARWVESRPGEGDRIVSSRLLKTEILRVLRREGLEPGRADRLLAGVGLMPLSEPILRIAEGIRPHVRTLDAIHLATALHTMAGPTLVTHDARMGEVAATLGLAVHDPV